MSVRQQIAVASGKGGTGKTTVATNLARYAASMSLAVTYIDCDVEAPNGGIFLRPDISTSDAVTVEVPRVDKSKCTGCGKCGEVCQYNAIISLGDKNVLTFDNLCHSCGGCWGLCPSGAISPGKMDIGIIESGEKDGLGFASGTLSIGSVRSVSMIRQLKKRITKDRLFILDAPPGTACTAVETLRGCDFVLLVTEPTPFGLNDLKLAVELVREMGIDFAVVINRDGCGNDETEKYCQNEGIETAMKIPDDRRIAEAYSKGQIVTEALEEYRECFKQLCEFIVGLEQPI